MSRIKLLCASTALLMGLAATPALAQGNPDQSDNRPDFMTDRGQAKRQMPQIAPLKDETLDEIAELQGHIQKLRLRLEAAKLEEQIKRLTGEDAEETEDDTPEAGSPDDEPDDAEESEETEDRTGGTRRDPAPGYQVPTDNFQPPQVSEYPATSPAVTGARDPVPSVKSISGAGDRYRARLLLDSGATQIVREGETVGDAWEVVQITRATVVVRSEDGTEESLEMLRAGATPSADTPPAPQTQDQPPAAQGGYAADPYNGGSYRGDPSGNEPYGGEYQGGGFDGPSFEPAQPPETDRTGSSGDTDMMFDEPIVVDGFGDN